MDEAAQRTEIGRILAARADETGITEHNVAARAIFDKDPEKYDVVTDITPEIIDDQSPEGSEAKKLWQDLMEALKSDNRFVALVRFEVGLDPHTPHSEQTVITTAYIRIFEQASKDNLRFVKGAGDSFVTLDGLHTLIKVSYINQPREEISMDTSAVVALQDKPDVFMVGAEESMPELALPVLVATSDGTMQLYDQINEILRRPLNSNEFGSRSPQAAHVEHAVMAWAIDQERASQEPLSS